MKIRNQSQLRPRPSPYMQFLKKDKELATRKVETCHDAAMVLFERNTEKTKIKAFETIKRKPLFKKTNCDEEECKVINLEIIDLETHETNNHIENACKIEEDLINLMEQKDEFLAMFSNKQELEINQSLW